MSRAGALPALAARAPRGAGAPLYRLVADDLRQQIADGALQPGGRIPPLRLLRDRYRVADMTVRSALRVLQDEGLLHTLHGRGSFVALRSHRP
ncbi:winged helix-turn-helix domain-containing protein [Streptomyces sp. NPDC051907]|uniref:winged helix-turn-helix domain-containing protein n=1 Tax=Streptomyces sp. NPDC051907 TaxID=3155284 RepID=UPI00342D4D50